MPLTVEADGRRDRSKSRSRDGQSQNKSKREPKTYHTESTYFHPDDSYADRYDNKYSRQDTDPRPSYPSESSTFPLPASQAPYLYDNKRPSSRDRYSRPESPEPIYPPASFPDDDYKFRRESKKDRHHMSRRDTHDSKYDRPGDLQYAENPGLRYTESGQDGSGIIEGGHDRSKFLPPYYNQKSAKIRSRRFDSDSDEALAYGRAPPLDYPTSSPPTYGSYIPISSPGHKRRSRHKADYDERSRPYSLESEDESHIGWKGSRKEMRSTRSSALASGSSRHTRHQSRDRRYDSPSSALLTTEPDKRGRDKSHERHRKRSHDRRSSTRESSPPLTARMSSLTVDTARPASKSLAAAQGSPLLESYHGTYQDCSPMPSPLLLASQPVNEISGMVDVISPLNSDADAEGDGKKRNRRARFHDPEDIALSLAGALKGGKPPDTEPLIQILPSLSHQQVMELRAEYKRIVKTGPECKGVNVAKHIRVRLKDEDPMLMKACYSVALGMWESEAFWANFWYQGDKTRRELLIETLMGRTNDEIRHIKKAFADKKYDNSLTKCMRTELKEDKFKKAVLMVLEERRMEDYDQYGRRIPLDYDIVDHDVDELRRALQSSRGGESLMISIILQRSDSHLQAILKEYERHYRGNFAREALKKSGNLVGELLAHVLNGVINRPVRDALLLHHALAASRKDNLRRELLLSRLVRYHWDPAHMQAVKRAYAERYDRELQDAVRDATSGDWGVFCLELCIARMPNHVRHIERVNDGR